MAKVKKPEEPQVETKDQNLTLSNPGATRTKAPKEPKLVPIGTSGTLFVQHN